jgi:Ribosomal protein L9, C-terminal domain
MLSMYDSADERYQIVLKTPVKSVGMHEVPVLLHPEIEALITINVARSAAEAERLAKGEAFNVVTSVQATCGRSRLRRMVCWRGSARSRR